MADRRMFAKTIIDSDAFLDMPMSSQALYFHLSMRADDEGFINNPKKIQRMIGASEDDLKLLLAKNFILAFESGVIVIKHWKIHNYIRGDRLKDTVYQDERRMLTVKENGAYSFDADQFVRSVSQSSVTCLPNDSQMSAQDRLGKVSIGKDNITGIESVFPDPDPELIEAWNGYVAMRKKIKASLTDRATQLALNNLVKLSGGDRAKAIKILDQSVMNGWKGLFELKGEPAKSKFQNFDQRENQYDSTIFANSEFIGG